MSWMERLKLELAAAQVYSENAHVLNADIVLMDAGRFDQLRGLQKELGGSSVSLKIVDAKAQDGHDLLSDPFNGDASYSYRLVCIKAPIDTVLCFFYASYFKSYAVQEPSFVESARVVYIADLDQEVAAVDLKIEQWTGHVAEPIAKKVLRSPREFVNDASGIFTVPAGIGSWISDHDDVSLQAVVGRGFGRRLGLVLPSSVLAGAKGRPIAMADVKRKVVAEIEDASDGVWCNDEFIDTLILAAKWVYAEGADVENRHSILSAEIARSFPRDAGWGAGLSSILGNALDSARIAYRLHLYDKSIDALKLMSDLRKGLADDVKSVSSQMSTLSAGLWRDAAVAVGAIALKSVSASMGSFILAITAVYLIASWWLNTGIARDAVANISINERLYRKKLFSPILADGEYNELAGQRYSAVLSEFSGHMRSISAVYWAAILLICIMVFVPYVDQIRFAGSCATDHFARYLGRLFMPDGILLFPIVCPQGA